LPEAGLIVELMKFTPDPKEIVAIREKSCHSDARIGDLKNTAPEKRGGFIPCIGVAPNLFLNAGPSCVSGPCPEGAMSCKKSLKVKQRHRELFGKVDI
jgi:hypothetical protein